MLRCDGSPDSSLTVETVPSVSWVSSRLRLPWVVPLGSGSASLTALTIVGMSSVVSGRVFCRLSARWAVNSEDFLFRVDAIRVWLAFPCVIERVVGVLAVESDSFEWEVGPRATAEPVFFFADCPVVLVDGTPCDPRVVEFFFAFFAMFQVNTSKQVLTGHVLLTPHARLLLLMPPVLLLMLLDLLSGQKAWCLLPPINYV